MFQLWYDQFTNKEYVNRSAGYELVERFIKQCGLLRYFRMKVGLYNYFDPFGGAGRATWRIFQALKSEGIDASLNIVKAFN